MSKTELEKNKNPQKRIEYRGKNVRVSRTGGISATKTFKGDGHDEILGYIGSLFRL